MFARQLPTLVSQATCWVNSQNIEQLKTSAMSTATTVRYVYQ
jgi:hypothetical protein